MQLLLTNVLKIFLIQWVFLCLAVKKLTAGKNFTEKHFPFYMVYVILIKMTEQE